MRNSSSKVIVVDPCACRTFNGERREEENPGETNEKVRLIPTHLERQVMGGDNKNKELDKTSTEVVLG
jgi:hypothetical protein